MPRFKTQFVPIQIRHIDDGEFLVEANEKLYEMQQRLTAFVKRYGESATGATGTVTLTLKVKAAAPEHDLYQVSGGITETLPKPPAKAKMVNSSIVDDKSCLVTKETIDEETGEIMVPGKLQ